MEKDFLQKLQNLRIEIAYESGYYDGRIAEIKKNIALQQMSPKEQHHWAIIDFLKFIKTL